MPKIILVPVVVYSYKELDQSVQQTARDSLYRYLDEKWFEYEIPDLVHNYWFKEDGTVWDQK